MEKISVGIIGAGRFGQLHLKAYADSDLAQINAICDTNPETLKKLCDKYNCKGYLDYHEFLSQANVEATSICLPPYMQADIAVDALHAGKHIMLEKPVATTLQDAQKIKSALAQSKQRLVAMVGYIERYNPSLRRVKELLKEDYLGDLYRISIKRGSRFSMRVPWAWETGMFVHMLGHNIDILRWFLEDEVERVNVESDSFMHKVPGEDDNICALIRFKKGAIAVTEDCWTLPGNYPHEECDFRMDIVGTKGSMIVDNTNQMISLCNLEKGWYYPGSLRWPGGVENASGMESYALKDEMNHFLRCVRNPDLKPVSSIDDAIVNMQVSLACEESARKHCPIYLNGENS